MVLPASLNRNNEHVECGVVVGLWETVFVQYIRNPGYFVVQYERDIAKIEQMSVEINVKCHGKPLRPVTDLQLGQFSVKLSLYLIVSISLCCRTPCLVSAADHLETLAFNCFIQEEF